MTTDASGRRLLVATVILVVVDAIGGVLAVSSGVNTWGEAWGSEALLAAPLPMVAAQLVLAWSSSGLGTYFHEVQAVELVAGAVNITLMTLNVRDGLRRTRRIGARRVTA